jgi:hypothetical protein
MNCNNRASTIGMAQEMMATPAANNLKAQPAQRIDQTFARDSWKFAHT